MSSRTMTVAIIGTNFGCTAHCHAFRAAGFDVAVLVGRDPERTARRALANGVPHATTIFDEALERKGIDAVVISTPPDTHRSLTLRALAAGKHVLCEKPMALNSSEAHEMYQAAKASGLVHAIGTSFRWTAASAGMRYAVSEGLLGDPLYALFQREHSFLSDNSEAGLPEWWTNTERGAGWLSNSGPHVLDQIRFVLGEFEDVAASMHIASDFGLGIDDTYVISFRMRNGLAGIAGATARAHDIAWGTRIVGTKATLAAIGDTLLIADRQGSRPLELPEDLRTFITLRAPTPEDDPGRYTQMHLKDYDLSSYIAQAAAFRDTILQRYKGRHPAPDFRDGLIQMLLLDAVRESAVRRQVVKPRYAGLDL